MEAQQARVLSGITNIVGKIEAGTLTFLDVGIVVELYLGKSLACTKNFIEQSIKLYNNNLDISKELYIINKSGGRSRISIIIYSWITNSSYNL